MQIATIGKQFRFEAGHHLPYHQGKCHAPHGHSYLLEVQVRDLVKEEKIIDEDSLEAGLGISDPESGMVTDFDTISQPIKKLIDEQLDHKNLNDLISNPTAENIVMYIGYELRKIGVPWSRLRLWETYTSYAQITSNFNKESGCQS